MSLEAWGDEGAGESDGYVTDERAEEMVEEAVADAIAPFLEILREIDNSDMALREEDEGRVSPLLEKVRFLLLKHQPSRDSDNKD